MSNHCPGMTNREDLLCPKIVRPVSTEDTSVPVFSWVYIHLYEASNDFGLHYLSTYSLCTVTVVRSTNFSYCFSVSFKAET